MAHSLALLADAGHNFGDVLGLLLAWCASYLAKTQPTTRRTYGLGRSSILAALANAILLLIAVGAITWEAIRRFSNPDQVGGKTVMIVAAMGIVIASGYVLVRAADNSWEAAAITGAAAGLMLGTRINPLWILVTAGAIGGLGLI